MLTKSYIHIVGVEAVQLKVLMQDGIRHSLFVCEYRQALLWTQFNNIITSQCVGKLHNKMKYAIQHKISGQLVDYCDTMEQAQPLLNWSSELEVVDTTSASKIEVIYTELGGPWGYGHQEPSFTTYGSIMKCVRSLYKWIQDSARVLGPDARDIRDYFRHCRLYINGKDKSSWLFSQIDKIDIKTIYS